jgi:septal ring factor EnvC (AmiA/AmiB activator)
MGDPLMAPFKYLGIFILLLTLAGCSGDGNGAAATQSELTRLQQNLTQTRQELASFRQSQADTLQTIKGELRQTMDSLSQLQAANAEIELLKRKLAEETEKSSTLQQQLDQASRPAQPPEDVRRLQIPEMPPKTGEPTTPSQQPSQPTAPSQPPKSP